ncbi:hypothetical protein L210DRAFT_876957, partial [Boletus edulis BED1]
CQYSITHGSECGAILPANPVLVSEHLRTHHALGGSSRESTTCLWQHCHSRPMQRQNLIRHVLSIHLALLRWRCPACLKEFSRRGTPHRCHLGGETVLHG